MNHCLRLRWRILKRCGYWVQTLTPTSIPQPTPPMTADLFSSFPSSFPRPALRRSVSRSYLPILLREWFWAVVPAIPWRACPAHIYPDMDSNGVPNDLRGDNRRGGLQHPVQSASFERDSSD